MTHRHVILRPGDERDDDRAGLGGVSAIEAASLLPPTYAVEIRAVVEPDPAGERVG